MQEKIEKIKTKYNHIFDIDDQGRITLKPGFHPGHGEIPPFTLVPVEGGSFVMGDGIYIDNLEVTVSSFFMAEFQVTQELYRAVTGKSPSNFQGIHHPVEQVSWLDVVQFCNQLNKAVGLAPISNEKYDLLTPKGQKAKVMTEVTGFRLPTEAEWEYAAGGGKLGQGKKTSYAGSDDLDAVGWYDDNNDYETKPVGLKFPNQLGLYDMSGNVLEWCWDWYNDDFNKKPEKNNPVNLVEGTYRILRGGSWNDNAISSWIAYRDYGRWCDDGVRLVFAF